MHFFLTLAATAAIFLSLTGCKENLPMGASSSPRLIALFTDYGTLDPYVSQLKGAMYTVNPHANLVDLTHSINPYNVPQAAYLLNQSAQEFPAETIFVAVVDPGVGSAREPVLIKTNSNKYYIGPDNGLFSSVINREGFAKAWRLDKPEFFRQQGVSATFHGRDIFGPVAAHLAAGVDPEKLGSTISRGELRRLESNPASSTGGTVTAEVRHIDRFGNIITNVPTNSAEFIRPGVLLRVTLKGKDYSMPVVETYAHLTAGKLGLLYGSSGFLEICANQGNAGEMIGAKVSDPIILRP